ncbi:hypothetical protein [Synechocystis sp. PCC 6714]|uniref:hypothetical protein n=2 Tax=unclassified Synechocystis TaxID=2640012 RepID=UPI0004026CAF|nr:hypothetical protein [Synechocystis sp. PCC 6714]AIE73096.1 hypothetical protein D082_05670 [Synechocystis sp. PCC 6714]
MKTLTLSTATLLLLSLTSIAPAMAQSETINCVRNSDVINCSDYGSFRYQTNNNHRYNSRPTEISCLRNNNVINCPNYGSFRYQANNNRRSNIRYNRESEINNLFLQVLGRNATSNEIRDFTQTINSQGWSSVQVRENLINSEEFYQSINNFYREYLGQNLDNNSLVSYRNLIVNGRSLADIKDEISNSTEARNRNYNNRDNYNQGNYNSEHQRQFNDMYIQVLGRNSSASELRNYNQFVNNSNYSLAQARRDLVNSQDFKQALDVVYQEYLGRNADSQGLQGYRNAVIAGSTFENVRNEIVNSPEANRYNSNLNNDDYYNRSGGNSLIQGVFCNITGICF